MRRCACGRGPALCHGLHQNDAHRTVLLGKSQRGLVFVEGEDDAKVFRILLNQQLNNRKKYMFWVLGGISEVFENILSYKAVFSGLKNGTSLWDKSVLVFDKDELSNEHKDLFTLKFKEKLGVDTYCANSYSFESTLFTDLRKTAKLLSKLIEKATTTIVSEQDIFDDLAQNYLSYDVALVAKFNDEFHKYFENIPFSAKSQLFHF